MLLRLLEEQYPLDAVVFYDTGMEFDAIYRIRDRIKNNLADQGVEFVELYPTEPFLYSMTERKVTSKQKGTHFGYGWCGGLCRWGTRCKLDAIKAFKRSLHDEIIDYVGIAADEPKRFEKAKAEGKRLPLVEWSMTEADCLAYCRAKGWHWTEHSPNGDVDLYDMLDRVSCWCCANKNLKGLRNIYLFLPRYWNALKELQLKIERPFKGYYNGSPKGIFELERRFEMEVKHGSCKNFDG